MFQNQSAMNTANWLITNGMTVYATDGTKLGTVRNYDPQAGFLDVHRGVIFTKEFYVPFSAVDTVTEDGVTLGLSKDALDDERYHVPPSPIVMGYGQTANDTLPATDKGPLMSDSANQVDPLTVGRAGRAD